MKNTLIIFNKSGFLDFTPTNDSSDISITLSFTGNSTVFQTASQGNVSDTLNKFVSDYAQSISDSFNNLYVEVDGPTATKINFYNLGEVSFIAEGGVLSEVDKSFEVSVGVNDIIQYNVDGPKTISLKTNESALPNNANFFNLHFISESARKNFNSEFNKIIEAAKQNKSSVDFGIPCKAVVKNTLIVAGGSPSSPSALNYGPNIIDTSTNNSFILPEPKQGSTVEIIQNGSFAETTEYRVYPPNSVSRIDELPDGNYFQVSRGEKSAKFTCVKNPIISVWTSSTNRTNVKIPLGTVSVSHTNGTETIWSGNDQTTSAPGSHFSAGSDSAGAPYSLFNAVNGWTVQSPTGVYSIVGYDVRTNVPFPSSFSLAFNIITVRSLQEHGSTFIPLGQVGKSNLISMPNLAAWNANPFSPANGRFTNLFINPSKGVQCYSEEFNPTFLGFPMLFSAPMSNAPEPNAPLNSATGFKEYGQGVFAAGLEIGATAPTDTYTFEIDIYVDFLPK